MRRRSEMDDSSGALELFLDTLCNAFGGIIFISLLVCILLQQASDKMTVDPEDKAKLESQLAQLTGEIKNLTGNYKSLQGQIEGIPKPDPDLLDKYRRLKQEQVDEEKIEQDLADALGRLTIEIKTKGPFLAQLEKKRDDLTAEQLALKEELDKNRVQANVRYPRAGSTKKIPVYIMAEGKRFALVHKFNEQGRPIGKNDTDISFKDIGQGQSAEQHLRLKADGGAVVTSDDEFADRFGALISRFIAKPTAENGVLEKDCHYFPVAVWPDSYTQFEILRDLLLEHGFGYGLILMEEGKPAVLTQRGERPPDQVPPSHP